MDLTDAGLGGKVLKEIYDTNNNLAMNIINYSDKIIPYLEKKELTIENLKNSTPREVSRLARKDISAQQLKENIAARAEPVGKWTAKVQEGRQTLSKETKGSQR
ncbi:MAG: hypothetical protein ACIPMY_03055 [Rickettsia endosymbiont of Pentastiridius leporinus]